MGIDAYLYCKKYFDLGLDIQRMALKVLKRLYKVVFALQKAILNGHNMMTEIVHQRQELTQYVANCEILI